MKEFLEKILHCSVKTEEYYDNKKLPLALRSNFNLEIMIINGIKCIFVKPFTEMNLSTLRKQWKQLENLTGIICVLCFEKINAYAKDRMIEEGIPFVVKEKQIFLPFLGLSLSNDNDRMLKQCTQISFLTQKMLLVAIYESWEGVSVTEAAQKLNVTKTSVTRSYDEIEAMGMTYIQKRSRSRLFNAEKDHKKMWNDIKGQLRNPILREFYFKEDIKNPLMISGLSALGYYSMLNDNPYPVYAATKNNIGNLLRDNEQIHPDYEEPGCLIQEIGYEIQFKKGKAVDPLSLWLMIKDEDINDPRIEKAIEEMMEEEVWSKD